MSGFDFDKGKRARDQRLRRSLLDALYHLRRQAPEGGASGRLIFDSMPRGDAGIQDDAHAVGLLRDLDAMGLITLSRLERRRGQSVGPDQLFARITALGVQLVDEHVPPVPGVYDERLPAEDD